MTQRIVRHGPWRFGVGTLLAGVVLALVVPAGGAAAQGASRPQARVVTAWPFNPPLGSFAESMALGRDGNLYVSLTVWGNKTDTARLFKVSPSTGARVPFGPAIDVGQGLLTGVAFDRSGRLYVAAATFSSVVPPGVLRVDSDGHVTRVATLPADSFPNGLAFRQGRLYVTDSALGAIWRVDPRRHARLSTPWLVDRRLAPAGNLGANGIAVRRGELYVAVSDTGRIVRIAVRGDGLPGAVGTVVKRKLLVTADGIAFSASGRLWITTNGPTSGRLLRLTPAGSLVVVVNQPRWFDYPTQPVLAAAANTRGDLFVANGSFNDGKPSIVALHLGVRGVLP
jgi:sugar lactone lactonase YvrE